MVKKPLLNKAIIVGGYVWGGRLTSHNLSVEMPGDVCLVGG